MLKVIDVYKTYKKGKQVINALNGLSFEVNENESFAIIGPNGAGKTTTIKIILNLIYPDKGKVLIFDKDVLDYNTRRYIGFAPEIPYYPLHMTAFELLKIFINIYNINIQKNKIEEYFELVKLKEFMNVPLSNYSKGMLQRFSILQAIIIEPKLLILDELTSGLDPIGQFEIIEIVKKLKGKTTILFTSHNLSEVEQICDRLVIINKGKAIFYGSILELKQKFSFNKYVLKYKVDNQIKEIEIDNLENLNIKENEIIEIKKKELSMYEIFFELITKDKN
ncbi:MAG: ABC transporter ATP-binding protein [bacterium]|nr:ABC transporter ATP-binding protein [bacterium]